MDRRGFVALGAAAGLGGLGAARPDQQYFPPPGGQQIPGARTAIRARQVLIIGGGALPGLFMYSPAIGAGNLLASITPVPATDAFGNTALADIISYAGNTGAGTVQYATGLIGNGVGFYTAAGGPTESGWFIRGTLQLDPTGLILQVQSFASMQVNVPETINAALAGGGLLVITNTTAAPTAPNAQIVNAGANDDALSLKAAADAFPRFVARAGGRLGFGGGTAAVDAFINRVNTGVVGAVNSTDFSVSTAGNGLRVAEGANAKQGTATLAAGAVTVANTAVTANSRIFLTSQVNGVTGALRVSARTAGTSFVITSSNAGDAGLVAYEIFEPG